MYIVPQHYQQVHIMSPLFFLTFCWFFFIIFALITILESAHRPCKQYPYQHHHPYFFLILPLFFKWKCKTFHIWHFLAHSTLWILVSFWLPDSSTVPLHSNDSLDHRYCFFFLLFHDFSAIFVLFTIFGNRHRPHQQYSNISPFYVYYFCWFFFWFSGYICINYYI